jgi:hypothetical protein
MHSATISRRCYWPCRRPYIALYSTCIPTNTQLCFRSDHHTNQKPPAHHHHLPQTSTPTNPANQPLQNNAKATTCAWSYILPLTIPHCPLHRNCTASVQRGRSTPIPSHPHTHPGYRQSRETQHHAKSVAIFTSTRLLCPSLSRNDARIIEAPLGPLYSHFEYYLFDRRFHAVVVDVSRIVRCGLRSAGSIGGSYRPRPPQRT